MSEINNQPSRHSAEGESSKKQASSIAGALAAGINTITPFFKKPWHQALPLLRLKNKKRVTAYVLLYLSTLFPTVSIWGDDVFLFPDTQGFLGFTFITAAIIASISYATGVLPATARHASKVVLGIILLVIGKNLWELISFILDIMDSCGRECRQMFELSPLGSNLNQTIIESLNIGFYLFIPALILLFPCALSKQFKSNQALTLKLKEINALSVEAKKVTPEDVQFNINKASRKGKSLLITTTTAIKNTDITKVRSTLSKAIAALRSGEAFDSIKKVSKRKALLIVAMLIFLVWLVYPSPSVTGPTRSEAENLYRSQPEFMQLEQLAYFGQMFGQNNQVKFTVDQVDNCKAYTFDDNDVGVACDVAYTLAVGQDIETTHERALFYFNSRAQWEYHGVD